MARSQLKGSEVDARTPLAALCPHVILGTRVVFFNFFLRVPVRFSSQRFNSAESLATRCIHMFEVVSVTSTETSGMRWHMAALACNQSGLCVCVCMFALMYT